MYYIIINTILNITAKRMLQNIYKQIHNYVEQIASYKESYNAVLHQTFLRKKLTLALTSGVQVTFHNKSMSRFFTYFN